MRNASKPQSNYRSAVNGQFVTKAVADRNPRETVRESRPQPATTPKKGR